MKITTPALKVSSNRINVVDSKDVTWVKLEDLKRVLPVPVTKLFTLTLSSIHEPYSVEVCLNRQQGTMTVFGAPGHCIQMNLGWNNFLWSNLITSGNYWLVLNPGPEPTLQPKSYNIPVDITYAGYVIVRATNIDEAERLALVEISRSSPFLQRCATPHTTTIDKNRLNILKKQEPHPRIGAFYLCKSTSRPQINGKVVELVEIKTARQVGVKDSFGDVYFTNPANLTYVRG